MESISYIGKIIDKNKMINLDLKNKKILAALMHNARTPYTTIAKIVQLSKSNIARRIGILEKNGLITGYNAFIDVSKIKINSCMLMIQTKCTEDQKERYIKKVATHPWVYGIDEFTGKFNIYINFYYKDEKHKDSIIEEILTPEHIKDFTFFNIETIFPKLDYTEELISRKTNIITRRITETSEKYIKISPIDIQLLKVLSENCRLNSVEIGKKLRISRETANNHIKKLINKKVIAKFQPTINFFLLEFEAYVLSIKLSKLTQKERIISYLANTERCNTILKTEGTYCIIAVIHFKSTKEFREFEKDFILKFGTMIYEYTFELFKHQEKLDWFPKGIIN